jgi:hypothetical protein
MLRTKNRIRLTKPEAESYRILTGETELPLDVADFNRVVETDAQQLEAGDDSAEAKLLAAMTRGFKVE